MGQFSCGTVFRGTICARGNYVGDKLSTQFPVGYCPGAIIFEVIVWEQLSRGNHSGGNYPVGQFSLWKIIPGGNCPGANCHGAIIWGAVFLGGNYPRGQFSLWPIVQIPITPNDIFIFGSVLLSKQRKNILKSFTVEKCYQALSKLALKFSKNCFT